MKNLFIILNTLLCSTLIAQDKILQIKKDSILINCYCDTISESYDRIGSKTLIKQIRVNGDKHNIIPVIEAFDRWTFSSKNDLFLRGTCRAWAHKKYDNTSVLFEALIKIINYMTEIGHAKDNKADFERAFYWLIVHPDEMDQLVKHYNDNKSE